MRIYEIIKTRIDTLAFEAKFGKLLDSSGRPKKETEINFGKFFFENKEIVDPMMYWSILDQKIAEVYHGAISESIDTHVETSLVHLFEQFGQFASSNSNFQSGETACLLELTALDLGPKNRTINISGFSKPERIEQIDQHYVYFENRPMPYPMNLVPQVRMWKQIALFRSREDQDRCVHLMGMFAGKIDSQNGEWNFEKINVE